MYCTLSCIFALKTVFILLGVDVLFREINKSVIQVISVNLFKEIVFHLMSCQRYKTFEFPSFSTEVP